MQLIYLIISILFIIGFYYVGRSVSNFFEINDNIKKISDPVYQNTSIGLASFIFVVYPIFFLGFFNYWFFFIISLIIIVFGFYNFIFKYSSSINLFKKKKFLSKNNSIINYFYIFLIILYFLLSIGPITSGDSVAYHMSAAKYILLNGKFPSSFYVITNAITGAGELLNAFALSIKAFQFTSLINFVGIISALGIIKKFSENSNLNSELKQLLFLCILSCPVLIFLVATSKSQLFSVSLIFISYALLFSSLNNNYNQKSLIKNFFICAVFCIVAVQTKISFSLSFFLIMMTFFIYFRKEKILFYFIFIFITLFVIGLMPQIVWKQNIYNYPFYNFLINPFPLNIPGYLDVFTYSKSTGTGKFPLSFFIPVSLSDLTQFIGVGSFSLFFLIKYNFNNKKNLLIIIFIFILIYSLAGQKTPRFYLEIYFLMILFLGSILRKIYQTFSFKLFKFLIIFQSIFVFSILIVGNYNLLPGIFSENLNKTVLSKYASGYNLYSWVNKVLPKNSKILTNHRSTYWANNETIYFEIPGYLNNADNIDKIYFLEKIKKDKPNFILFYGGDDHNYSYHSFNFYKCTNGLFSKKNNVGFHETRSIFTSVKEHYNGYIYNFDSSKLSDCVKFN